MIVVDLDNLKISYKTIPSSIMNELIRKHCNKVKCLDCKYREPLEDCELSYVYGHNLVKIDREKYAIISNEERHLIDNQNMYCYNTYCYSNTYCIDCKYNHLIYDKDGSPLDCDIARVIAHRILKGEITKDQYEIRK